MALEWAKRLLFRLAGNGHGNNHADSCCRGHRLKPFRTPIPGYRCSSCRKTLPASTVVQACRPCDYDLCTLCFARRRGPGPAAQSVAWLRSQGAVSANRVLRAAMILGLLYALRYIVEFAAVPLLRPGRQQKGLNWLKGGSQSGSGTGDAQSGWQLTVRIGLSLPATVRRSVRVCMAAASQGVANVQEALLMIVAWVTTILSMVADAWAFAWQWVYIHVAMVHHIITHWVTSVATVVYANTLASVLVLFNTCGGPAWVEARPWAVELSSLAAQALHAFIAVLSWAVKSVYTEKMGEVAITIVLIGGILLLKVAAYYVAKTACRIVVFLGIEAGVLGRALWKRVFLPPPPPPMSSSEAQAAALVAARQKRCLAAGLSIASGGIDRFRVVALKVVSLNRQANLVALMTKQKRVSVKYLASAGGRGHLSSGVAGTPAIAAGAGTGSTDGPSTGSARLAFASNAPALGEWGRGAIVEMRDPAASQSHHRHVGKKKKNMEVEGGDEDAPRLTGYAFANCGGSLDVRFPLRGEAWALAVPTDKLVWPEVVLPSALTPYPQPGEPAAANATVMVATTAAAASAAASPMTPLEVKTLASARSETLVAHRRAAQAAVQAEALSMAPNVPNEEEDDSSSRRSKKKTDVSALPLGALVEARWRGAVGDTSPATVVRATWEVHNNSNISFNGTTPAGHHSFDTWVRLGAAVSAQTSRYDRALAKAARPGNSNANPYAFSVPEAKEMRTSTSKKQRTFASRAAPTDNDNDDDDSDHDADDDIAAVTAVANGSKNAITSSAMKSSVSAISPKVRAALHSAAAAFAASGRAHRKVSFKEKVYDNTGAWRYDVHYADGSSELAVLAADLRRYYPYYVEDLGVKHKAQGRFVLVYDPDYHTYAHAHSRNNALTSYRHSGSLRSSSIGGTSPRSAPVVVEWDWFWLKAMSAVVAGLVLVLEHGKDYWNAYAGVHPCIVAAYQQAGVPIAHKRQSKQQQQRPPSTHADADANNVDISAFIVTSSRAVVTYIARFSVRLGAAASAAATLALEPTPGDLEASPRRKRFHSSSSCSSEASGGGWHGSSRSSRREDLFSPSTGAPHSSRSERGPWFVAATVCVSSHGLLVVTSTMSLMVAVILIRRVVAVGGLRECLRRPGLIVNGRKRSIIEKATAVATAAEGAGTPTKKGDVGKSVTRSEGIPTGEVVRFTSLSELEGLRVFVRHRGRAIERAATVQRAYFAPVAANGSALGINGASLSGGKNTYSSRSSNSHGSSSVAFAAVRAATVAASAFHRLQHQHRDDALRFDVLYDSGKMLSEHVHEHGHHMLRQESETSVPASCLRVAGPPPKLPVLPPPPPKNALKSFVLAAAANDKKSLSASLGLPSAGAQLLLARAGTSLASAPLPNEGHHCPAGHPTETTEATVTTKPCARCFRKLPVGAKLASCAECHVSYCSACVRHLALPPRAHGSAADRPIEESEAILKGASQRKRNRFVNYVAKTSSVLDVMQSTSHRTPLAKASQMDIGDREGPEEIPHLSQMASFPLPTLSSRFSKFN